MKIHENDCPYHYGHDCECGKNRDWHENDCGYSYGHDCDCGYKEKSKNENYR